MQPTTQTTINGFPIDLGKLYQDAKGKLANGLDVTVKKANELNHSFEKKVNKTGINALKLFGAALLAYAFYELFPTAFAILKIATCFTIAIALLFNKNIINGRDIPAKS